MEGPHRLVEVQSISDDRSTWNDVVEDASTTSFPEEITADGDFGVPDGWILFRKPVSTTHTRREMEGTSAELAHKMEGTKYEMWRNRQETLIAAECGEARRETEALRTQITTKGLEQKGDAVRNLVFVSDSATLGTRKRVITLKPSKGDKEIPFVNYKRGDPCALHGELPPHDIKFPTISQTRWIPDRRGGFNKPLIHSEMLIEGVLHSLDRETVAITVDTTAYRAIKARLSSGVLTLGIPSTNRAHDLRWQTWRELENTTLPAAELLHFILRSDKPAVIESNYLPIPQDIHPEQRAAVEFLLTRSPVAILHGPPGTGKTTTLAALIHILVEANSRILVCTGSNVACDNILARLLKVKGLNKSWLLRVAAAEKSSADVECVLVDAVYQKHDKFAEYEAIAKTRLAMEEAAARRLGLRGETTEEDTPRPSDETYGDLSLIEKRLIRDITRETFRKARAIFTTCTSAASPRLSQCEFDYVVIDEAAQCLEIDALIAVKRGVRLILAGDHQQLGPVVKNLEVEGTTLMGHLMESDSRKLSIMLKTQFRSNHLISDWSSRHFYGGAVRAHESVRDTRVSTDLEILHWYKTPAKYCPEIAAVTDSTQILTQNSSDMRYLREHSLCNLGEAILTLEYLYKFLYPLRDRIDGIGIISPYKKQVKLLQELMADSTLLKADGFDRKILVSTVDGFQGGERDIMILSLVRCNQYGNIGFVGSANRLNVAVTRARKHLVIFGNHSTFSGCDLFASLIEHIQSHGKITDCNDVMSIDLLETQYSALRSRLKVKEKGS